VLKGSILCVCNTKEQISEGSPLRFSQNKSSVQVEVSCDAPTFRRSAWWTEVGSKVLGTAVSWNYLANNVVTRSQYAARSGTFT
jgi:hypothetical protein